MHYDSFRSQTQHYAYNRIMYSNLSWNWIPYHVWTRVFFDKTGTRVVLTRIGIESSLGNLSNRCIMQSNSYEV
jgi:hypothetical protein